MTDGTAADLLAVWIGRQASPAAMRWLDEQRAAIRHDCAGRALALAFSLAPRRIGKALLALSDADRAAAGCARPAWSPVRWSLDDAARILLLLDAPIPPDRIPGMLEALAASADVGESIALYRGLPLYPNPAALVPFATAGLRTAMRTVFEAVAHHNPFPAEHFPQESWNQMVLKALFIDAALHPIEGLDRRWNADLARTLCDYAHERWSAGRPVSPELWRGVGRFADDAAIGDLARVLDQGSAAERAAAALALSESDRPAAASHLDGAPELFAAIKAGRLAWSGLPTHPGTIQ